MPGFYPTAPGVRFRNVLPGYCVGDDGSVWSRYVVGSNRRFPGSSAICGDRWVRLKFGSRGGGYLGVTFCYAGRTRTFAVHSVVLQAFVGPRPPGMECRHLDGNRTNNHLYNLTWGTRQQNCDDQYVHGTRPQGDAHGQVKVSDAGVREILRLLKAGVDQYTIAAQFGVSSTLIRLIGQNKTRKSIPRDGFIMEFKR
jgi:hypothetical protein